MRIGVIGAGALGSLLAARLQLAGHEVQVVARGLQRDVIREVGITIRGPEPAGPVAVLVVDRLNRVDLCLVCVKAQDTQSTLAEHARDLTDTDVVLVQNGLSALDVASAYLPRKQLFGALSFLAANFAEPGIVTVTRPELTVIGRGSGAADQHSVGVAAVLNGAIPTVAIDDFVGAQWTKLIVNMVNALPAITGLSVQLMAQRRLLLNIWALSIREAARIGIALGIQFAPVAGLTPELVAALARQPLWRTRRVLRGFARNMGPVPNLASMLQSIQRGRPTEVDYLNGAVVTAAESAGLDAPVNRELTAIVHTVERTGTHLSGLQLSLTLCSAMRRNGLSVRGLRIRGVRA